MTVIHFYSFLLSSNLIYKLLVIIFSVGLIYTNPQTFIEFIVWSFILDHFIAKIRTFHEFSILCECFFANETIAACIYIINFIILNDRHLKHTKWIMLKPSHWPSKNQALLHAKIKRKNISSCCWTIWKNVNSSICSLRAPEERWNQYRAVLHSNSIAEQSALATIF